MKKMRKILIVILIILLTFCCFSCIFKVNAMGVNDLEGNPTSAFDNVGNAFLRILSIVGSGLSIIFIICLGIKYMMGSVEEKAEYKKSLLPYLVGAIFVFGASAIASAIYNMF